MKIYLMNTPTDPEHVIKEIMPTDWRTSCIRTGTIRGDASEDNMEFDVAGDVIDQNYCYIPTFRRFYWITERNVYRTGITTLTLTSDPLMSFYSGYTEGEEHIDGIEDLPMYVTRCSPAGDENTLLQLGFNSYLRDDGVPVIAKVRTELHLVPYFNQLNSEGEIEQVSFDYSQGYWLVTVG